MDGIRLPDTIWTVPQVLAFWAELTPHAPALVVPGQTDITYGELWRRVARLGEALQRSGIKRDDRVVLLVPDGPRLAVALLGAMTAAIAIPLDARLPAAELEILLQGLETAATILSLPISPDIAACLDRHGGRVFALDAEETLAELRPMQARHEISTSGAFPHSEDIALVLLTSGTTGVAKRVPDTHAELLCNARGRRDQFGLTPADRALAVAPLTLSLGTCVLFHTLVSGGAWIVPPASDLDSLFITMTEQRATWMFPSAGLLELMALYLRSRPHLRQPLALRLVRVTAAPVSAALCAEVEARLGAPVLNSYSSTEAGLVATALPPPAAHKVGSAGKPIVDLQIVRDDGALTGHGVAGEIWVRGEKFAAGYLDDPELNAEKLQPGGWFRTGDVGYLDEDGFLFLTGRLSQLVNRGGLKFAPEEVDTVLREHPAIQDAAAFAVPDSRLGEDVVAAVVAREDQPITARAIRAWLLTRLSVHKTPRRIWFVDELPRTALGKVRRDELRRRWLQEHSPS